MTRILVVDVSHPLDACPTVNAAAAGGEAAGALTAAARSYLLHPDDDGRAASAIVAQVGWWEVRARWFLSVNQDRVRESTARLRAERSPEIWGTARLRPAGGCRAQADCSAGLQRVGDIQHRRPGRALVRLPQAGQGVASGRAGAMFPWSSGDR